MPVVVQGRVRGLPVCGRPSSPLVWVRVQGAAQALELVRVQGAAQALELVRAQALELVLRARALLLSAQGQ